MKTLYLCFAVALTVLPVRALADAPVFKAVDIGGGVTLHYAEEGHGRPVIFVHGSLTDYDYWADTVRQFSAHSRAIAYSRRYNMPNHNAPISGYSALTDADDLAAFIRKLGLRDVDIVGHSYGALTSLILAYRHPELVHKVVLAEPPAVSLLPAPMRDDVQRRMVAPMQRAFRAGQKEKGVSIFIDYVFNNPRAWQEMSLSSRVATMADAHEWDVMLTRGTFFPEITDAQVRSIRTPVLILTGTRTYPFLRVIDNRLQRLLPNSRQILLSRSGHQMWYSQAEDSRRATEQFFR